MITNFGLLLALTLCASPDASAPSVESQVQASSASFESLPVPGGWRAFATECQAINFARLMERRGYCTNVFYDPYRGWWVCEFF